MGADLLAIIAVGPKQLDRSKKNAAIKLVAAKIRLVNKAIELDKKMVALSNDDAKYPEAEELALDALSEARKSLGCDDDSVDEADALPFSEYSAQKPLKTAKNLVSRFIDLWEHPGRGGTYRENPDNSKEIIWVCGDMSCGDEPDSEEWETYRDMERCGVPELFGIR